jgi:hypothetical protein
MGGDCNPCAFKRRLEELQLDVRHCREQLQESEQFDFDHPII